MHKRGIIDFEYADYVPFGYDLVTAIEHISFFPRGPRFEFEAKYHFTALQKKRYYQMVDSLCREYGLPVLSKNKEAFIFCRLVWAAVRMQNKPQVQAWRFRLLRKKFL